MKALVFRYSVPRLAMSKLAGTITPRGYFGPWSSLRMEDVPGPALPGDDWAIIRTRLAGVCGSDAKQAFLRGDRDNALTALLSFPHILGHEATGVIERLGPGVRSPAVGQRVVLNPWLSCGPRGFGERCVSCEQGQYPLCERFTEGRLPPGIHNGNCAGAGGAFAEAFPAHMSQLFTVPDGVSDEQAVLADPASVQLHALLRHPPPEGAPALVYGCGTLGLITVALLRVLHPGVEVWAVARHAHQGQRAKALGAAQILPSDPAALIEAVARLGSTPLLRPWRGLPWLMRGAGVVYDTIGSPSSLETAVRVASPRSTIAVTGVEAPRRFEWTPYYFKELNIAGSNAFGIEEFEGKRRHAFEIYFDLVKRGLDLSQLITHRVPLRSYREAFLAQHDHGRSGAIKTVFAFDPV